ncbi:MAG: amidohydrolase family protein [Gammaproteobacteria bacterium]|nr:amidohydrolase family protein [Gammaproteobacteria bacterium]
MIREFIRIVLTVTFIFSFVENLSAKTGEAGNIQIIHAGALLAVPGKGPMANASVIVEAGKVAEVRAGFVSASDISSDKNQTVEIIDLRDSFVLPGLMDMHTHVTFEFSRDQQLRNVTVSDEDVTIDGVVFARRTLMAGFTTVRNVGAPPAAIFALRDAIAKGKVPGPRIIAAGGGVSPTGGHGDINGYRDDIFPEPSHSGICNGADDCRRAVRVLAKGGADVIKFVATGGVLSNTAAGTGQQFTDAEMVALIETAHALGRKVAAHAHGVDGINAALRAGVDSIEHGTYLDKESIRLFRKTGAYYVPTISAGVTVAEWAEIEGYLPPSMRDKARRIGPIVHATFARAYKGGVKIAFGTDSGVSKHGLNAREFLFMVEAGMPEEEAIKSATINTAILLGRADQLGTIEPGKVADIIATKQSPIDDIRQLQKVTFVMKDGVVYQAAGE